MSSPTRASLRHCSRAECGARREIAHRRRGARTTKGAAIMTEWDMSVDLVIAGSGGGGLAAAIVAIDAGLEPLVIEKMPVVGGSTGMSGGMVWLPNNPLMRAEGVADSFDDGLAYLE